MPLTALSKYAENQALAATVNGFPLMDELVADILDRAPNITAGIAAFGPVLLNLTVTSAAWSAGMSAIANAEAAQLGATQLFDAHMASLTRRPDTETSSILDNWDHIITGEVPYQSATYTHLLPQGRDTLTAGTRQQQLDALHNFSQRLSALTAKPTLVTLGATVAAFETAGRTLRSTQNQAMSTVEAARIAQEPLRVASANAIYAVIGQGMVTWNNQPSRVDTLWDVNILRDPPRTPPAAPANTTWNAASRTLSTTALPENATRLEAWRVGPGGMPELLVTASPGATAVIIPANVTFTPGVLYQLWLVAINGRGRSAPGPKQSWTAG